MAEAWRGFKKDGHWDVDVNVRNFIQTNYTPYDSTIVSVFDRQ